MAHNTLKPGYHQLVDRLNRFPQGAPPSQTLYKILQLLFSEREAELVALLPIKPFRAAQAAKSWHMAESGAQKILEELAGRAILVDVDGWYTLPPPMAGFFEFSMMRLGGNVDQKLLGELYYQYLNVEEEFIKALFVNGETQLGRAFIQEAALSAENALHVLDYERASEVIQTASCRGIGVCYCRHKMQHVGRDCAAPKNICMTFNSSAISLTNNGYARAVDVDEGMDLLQEAYENNLVQFGENVQRGVNFICNCCGCCCEAMIAARKFGLLNPVHTTNFLPQIALESCNGCGKCVSACPVEAMTLVSANNPHHPGQKEARLNEEICLGCGVCTRTCPKQGISLVSRAQRVITPVNSVHRVVMMAIERGQMHNLIFDNQVLFSHRAMAAVLGAILKMPPIKQAMASQQMKSRYLLNLLEKMKLA
jgi:ferredoxin